MAKKGAFGGGQSQVYERCTGPACEGKDTPARKLMGLQAMDETGGRINFYPVCKDCEDTARANAASRKLPAPISDKLTKENAYVYREQLDSEAAEQFNKLKKNVNSFKPGAGNKLAKPEKQSKKVINPDPHGRMEHVYFGREPFEKEPKRAGTKGQESIGQRPNQQVGTAKHQKRLNSEQKDVALANEAANYNLGRDKGPWKPLSPRKTKGGKNSARLRSRTTWTGNPDPGTRRPTKESGELWKAPEKVISVHNARIRAADPANNFGLATLLGQGESSSLKDHLAAVDAAYTERSKFELSQKETKRGKKKQ